MAQTEQKKRVVLLRRLHRVDRKIAYLKKVLARLQTHLARISKDKAA